MARKINITFIILWGASLFLSLVETVTYSGFVAKHTGINPILVIVPTVGLALVLLGLNFMKSEKKSKKDGRAMSILSGFFLITYILLKIADRLTYANFVFSKLHVQPNNFLWSVLISLLPTAVFWLPRINYKKLLTKQSFLSLFIVSLIVFNMYKVYKIEWEGFQFIIIHPFASYDDKMREKLGSTFYNYTQFIDNHTQPDSSILIPPQAFPWPQSGNEAYMRYFIYPRKTINGGEFDSGVKFDSLDFVVLNWGETDSTQLPYTHGWPKFDVPAVKIIFMNSDGSYGGEVKGDYRYKDYIDKKVWGFIIIKH